MHDPKNMIGRSWVREFNQHCRLGGCMHPLLGSDAQQPSGDVTAPPSQMRPKAETDEINATDKKPPVGPSRTHRQSVCVPHVRRLRWIRQAMTGQTPTTRRPSTCGKLSIEKRGGLVGFCWICFFENCPIF